MVLKQSRMGVSKENRRTVKIEALTNREGWRSKIHSSSGAKYTGWWHKNQKHGVGEYVSPKDWLFSGYFNENKIGSFGVSGYGVGRNVYEIQYRGDWLDGHFHGNGVLHFRNGAIYKGTFARSKREGIGEMWYQNGSFYSGEWHEGKRHGEGIFVQANGNRFEGIFYKDMKQGHGRYFLLHTGQYMDGIWYKNMCITSIMADIPYRQTSVLPTEYTINEVQLDDETNKDMDIIESAAFNMERSASVIDSLDSNAHTHSIQSRVGFELEDN